MMYTPGSRNVFVSTLFPKAPPPLLLPNQILQGVITSE